MCQTIDCVFHARDTRKDPGRDTHCDSVSVLSAFPCRLQLRDHAFHFVQGIRYIVNRLFEVNLSFTFLQNCFPMRTYFSSTRLLVFLFAFSLAASPSIYAQQKQIKFVSSPDMFNMDIPDPMPEWDDAIHWYLQRVSAEDPDLFLVAGDLVMGEWWPPGPAAIEHMGLVYYGAYMKRMQRHDLHLAPAIGDHEIGDDHWKNNKKRKLVPKFKEVFVKRLPIPGQRMPSNEVVAYYTSIGDVLFITVDPFEKRGGKVHLTVSGKQLEWLKNVLKTQGPEANHIVVQAHTPVIGSPKANGSSQLMVQGGRNSDFWQVMKKGGVDVYLCGEFHALSTQHQDGIWQIVHGTSWGRKNRNMTYLVGHSTPNGLKMTVKSFPMDVRGKRTWNMDKRGGPREIVRIPKKVRENGPETVGSIILQEKNGKKQQLNASGVFDK